MTGALVLPLINALPFILWSIVNPRGTWGPVPARPQPGDERAQADGDKDPEANDPSETSYALSRAVGVILLVLLLVAVVAFVWG